MDVFDVIIIGGGPAGLNAAVVLGRCRRKVLLFDHGMQRNRYSHGMHNYLSRDNILPTDFLKICYGEVKKYGVKMLSVEVKHARKKDETHFEVTDCNKKNYYSKKLVLATGLTDILPALKGIKEFYGKSVFHCPYCDGWEVTDKKLGVYSKTKSGIDLALTLTTWSNDITLYTDGKRYVKPSHHEMLRRKNIQVVEEAIEQLQGSSGKIKNIIGVDGKKYPCHALFFSNGYEIQCGLIESLGCNLYKNKVAKTNKSQQTNIPGLYVAGDASRDMHFVVVASAEGAKAGVYINKELVEEDDKS